MLKPITLLLALLALATVTGCQDFPGANGEYATHDHGDLNRPARAQPVPECLQKNRPHPFG
jgi:hypothetical protein